MSTRHIFIILFLGFLTANLCSCSQTPGRRTPDPVARKLYDSAVKATHLATETGYRKAVSILNLTTTIDSNYFQAWYTKFVYQNQLGQYDSALLTAQHLIRMRPMAPDLYLSAGGIYEKLGDSLEAKTCFQKALTHYNNLLDTMQAVNRNYPMLSMNKGLTLILLGDSAKGNELLQRLHDSQSDEESKAYITSFMHKNRKELLEMGAESQQKAGSGEATLTPQ